MDSSSTNVSESPPPVKSVLTLEELEKWGICEGMHVKRVFDGDFRKLDCHIFNQQQENRWLFDEHSDNSSKEFNRYPYADFKKLQAKVDKFENASMAAGDWGWRKAVETGEYKITLPPYVNNDDSKIVPPGTSCLANIMPSCWSNDAAPSATIATPNFQPFQPLTENELIPKLTPTYDFHFGSEIRSGTHEEVMAFKINEKNLATSHALQELAKSTGMPITQENGQRRFGPPRDFKGAIPEKGCEVFIGKLPRDALEPELVPLLEKYGKIYELRLMMDFSGTNRGYCFVKFYTSEAASRAVAELDNYEIRKGRKIGVLKSVDNCRLFVGGIPREKTKDEIFMEMSRITKGVRAVICYPSIEDKTKNRGFAFIEYESHRAAAMARRKMLPKKISMWGLFLMVDWAEPLPEVENSVLEKVTNLFVRNLMTSTTEEALLEMFNKYSNNGVEKVKKIDDYAFVHFQLREQAELAMRTLDQTEIDGSKVEITWAKPVDKDVYKTKKAIAKSFNASRMQMQGPPDYGRPFGGFNASCASQMSKVQYPGPMHGGSPYSGMCTMDQDMAALQASFASQEFFPSRAPYRGSNYGYGRAAGIQNFHLTEQSSAHSPPRKALAFHDSPSGGYVRDPYMYAVQNPYYHQPVMYHQPYHHSTPPQFEPSLPQYGY